MKTKLIMVEGLPGFGKSTTSRMLHDILSEHNIEARLVMEGIQTTRRIMREPRV